MRYIWFLVLLYPVLASAQANEMHPYLQTPSATSMYVCWLAATGNESIVQYGTTEALGLTQSGDVQVFNEEIKWHWAKLQNLSPNTRYFYRCMTGSQQSDIYSFTTVPSIGTTNGHLRVIILGDTRTNTADVVNLVTAIQSKLLDLYGPDWRQMINLLCHTGDTVEWAGAPDPFVDQFFIPFSPLSSSIPIMVAPGNHEGENANFYDFMKTEDIAGSEGKKYFSFDLANSRFIFMNSNTQGNIQLDWLASKLSEASGNSNLEFVFGITHHFGHSELLTSENTNWVQNSVIPDFNVITKPTLLSYGHAHCYERGTAPWGRTRLLLCGGGGAPIDHWGNDPEQMNYPEIHIAMDYWVYTILDIDFANHTYEAKTYSLGNTNVPLDNIEIDSWTQSYNTLNVQANTISAKAPTNGQIKLVSAPAYPFNIDLMTSQIQVSTSPSFSSLLVDMTRSWVDFYEDTGTPDYIPINVNAGIDLRRYTIPEGILQAGQNYFWKVRYRSQNTDWGGWSNTQSFTNTTMPIAADFIYSPVNDINLPILFTDSSIGDPTAWSWDLDNDGLSESTSQDATWIFNTPGTKYVSLTVTINGVLYTTTKNFQIGTPNSDEQQPAYLTNLSIYPNPTKGISNICFNLANSSLTKIDVYNIRGEHIRSINSQMLPPGSHSVVWDGKTDKGTKAANGLYFIRLDTDKGNVSRKTILIQ